MLIAPVVIGDREVRLAADRLSVVGNGFVAGTSFCVRKPAIEVQSGVIGCKCKGRFEANRGSVWLRAAQTACAIED